MGYSILRYSTDSLRHSILAILLLVLTLTARAQEPNSKIHFNIFDLNKNVFKELLSAYILMDSAAKDKSNQPHRWQVDDTLTDGAGTYTVIGFQCVAYDTNRFQLPLAAVGKCFCDTFRKDRLPRSEFHHSAQGNYFEWPLGWGGTYELVIIRKSNCFIDTMTIGFKNSPDYHFGMDISFSVGKYVLDLKGIDSNYYSQNNNMKYGVPDITPKEWSKLRVITSTPENIPAIPQYLPKPAATTIIHRGRNYFFNFYTLKYQNKCMCPMDTTWVYERPINDKANKCIMLNGEKIVIAKGKKRLTRQGKWHTSMEPYGRWYFFDDNGKFISSRIVSGRQQN